MTNQKASKEQLSANAAENNRVAEEYFASIGLPGKARVDILTYDGWMKVGRKVKTGEKSHKHPTKNYPLFHRSQTEEIKPEGMIQ